MLIGAEAFFCSLTPVGAAKIFQELDVAFRNLGSTVWTSPIFIIEKELHL